ncbi:MAG TPA: hypothetical protein IGS53_14090 [Leptolyngbyaceae cyanobacterium M33_DOE_097]|nr:hypothetical protein [Leptolyngbyaceae cyanobacterium M33_DOE_097]
MNNIAKKIEITANIAIIILVVLLGAVLVKGFFLPKIGLSNTSGSNTTSGDGGLVGKPISIPDIDWSKTDRTLVLALQKDCPFCTMSATFYQRLRKELIELGGIRLVAVLPHAINEANDYLSELGVSVDEVEQVSLSSIGVKGTPTILLVDNKGIITNVWRGKLQSERENDILTRLGVNCVTQ